MKPPKKFSGSLRMSKLRWHQVLSFLARTKLPTPRNSSKRRNNMVPCQTICTNNGDWENCDSCGKSVCVFPLCEAGLPTGLRRCEGCGRKVCATCYVEREECCELCLP